MNIKAAKKIKVGDVVTLRYLTGEYTIRDIQLWGKGLMFRDHPYSFTHKEIKNVVKKSGIVI